MEILLDTEDYHVDMFVSVVHVSKKNDMWNFAMKVTNFNGCYDDLLGNLYDRIPIVQLEIKKVLS